MIERYKLYRSYGHSRWVALTLAPPPEAILIGALFGVVISMGILTR